MSKKYIRKFMRNEIDILNRIEKEKIRKSTMSIYSYLIKLFEKAGVSDLEISLRGFLKKYNNYHKNISHGTLSSRISELLSLGLLKLTKVGQKHIYKLDRFLDSFLDSSKCIQTTENSSFDSNLKSCKYKSLNKINNNIYINSSDEAEKIANEVIAELGIKSKWVKKCLLSTVKDRYKTINIAGAKAYMRIIILKLQAISESIYAKTKLSVKNNNKFSSKKPLKFLNYEQREYDYDSLENEVLGWC